MFGKGKEIQAIMFNEIVLTSQVYVRCVSAIQPFWIKECSPKLFGNYRKTVQLSNGVA